MGTKNNPGKFDCYAKAEPDEPMFVLLGRDPAASATIDFWIAERKVQGKKDPDEMVLEAERCANACADYRLERAQKRKGSRLSDLDYARAAVREMRLLADGHGDETPRGMHELAKVVDDIVGRNQNPETADGSISPEEWRKLARVCREAVNLLSALEDA